MSILRRDDTVTNALGNAISGAMVYYLTQPADVSALTPLADVYSDTTGTTAANPQVTDGYGHAVAYLNGGQLYTIVYAYPNGQQVIYADQFVGSSSGAPTPFGEVPTGTINGTNCIFSISKSLSQATVWLNFPLIPGLGYTLVGTVLTYANAPQIGDSLYVQGF
jgi:hypothetical protein